MKNPLRYLVILLLMAFISVTAMAQSGTIKGTVTDSKTGETLPGANIIVKGTTFGVSTDIDGIYIIEGVPAGSIELEASFVGFQPVTKTVNLSAGQMITVDFQLLEDFMMLNELVVVGFGTERKRDVTSSISKIPLKDMRDIPTTNFANALQGRAAGVQVRQDNGMAGAPITVRVRGTTSLLASSEPLYVVDGIPIVTGSLITTSGYPDRSNALNLLNPNDIESIEILKDASAAAIYGSRGANGVVLITTKKGKEGKTKFNFSYSSGISEVTNKLDILNGQEYLSASKQAWFNSEMGTEEEFYQNLPYGIYNGDLTYQENKEIIDNTNTDWVKTMLRTGFQHSFDLSASGGTKFVNYYMGGFYNKSNGIIVGNDFQRLGIKLNLEIKASKRLTVGTNLTLANRQYVNVPTGWAGGLGTAQSRSLPIMPVYNNDGTYFAPTSGVNVMADYEDRKYKAYTTSILGNVYGKYKITDYLYFNTDWGLNNIYQRETEYEGTITRSEANATDRRLTINNWNTNNSFNFRKLFVEKHKVSAMIGQSFQRYADYGLQVFGANFPHPSLENPTSTPANRQTTNGWQTDWSFLSFFGSLGYTFNDKYLVSFNIRRDGSSRFGENMKWGTFPGISAGWIITEENFLKDKRGLSFLKFRGSFGITGNAEIPNYDYIGTYYITEYNGQSAIGLNRKPNPNLHWEETSQWDVGFDIGFWEGRLSAAFDYYVKNSKDVLLRKQVPSTSGTTSVIDNVGEIENRGFEIFLSSFNFTGKFKWRTELNLARNANKIIDLEGQIISGMDLGGNYGNNYAQEGHPIGAWRLVEWHGVDPQTGQDLYVYADGSIGPWDESDSEFFDKNSKVVGNPYPEIYGGMNNILEWKSFDLGIYFTFAYGNDIYRDDGKFFEGGNIGSNWNQMATVLDAWTEPGQQTDQSQLFWNSSVSTYNSTKYLDDGSYLRLKALTLGYNLPVDICQKLKMDAIRIYFIATNLWTLTNYKGWDPEVNRDGSGNVTQGVTYLSPPQAKTYNVGINLSF